MSISDLTRLVRPPSNLTDPGSPSVWEAVQSSMGIRLPMDAYDYGVVYGSGSMCNGFFLLFNWASPHFEAYLDAECKGLRAVSTSCRQPAVFPDSPGLLPWGRDENGSSLCWFTGGEPDAWPVVVQSREGKQYVFQLSMTTFFARLFLNQISCPIWHEPFTPDELDFIPAATSPTKKRSRKKE
jgi:hypothetical protein